MFVEKTFLAHTRFYPLLVQIERFTITGGLCFVIDYALLIFCTEALGINYLWSATIAFCAGVTINYILSIRWVFVKKSYSRRQVIYFSVPFVLLSVLGLLLNNAIIYASVEYLALHYGIGKIIATFVVMIFNFVTRKILLETDLLRRRRS